MPLFLFLVLMKLYRIIFVEKSDNDLPRGTETVKGNMSKMKVIGY